jgi:DNA-binding LacI/PurR family transcriptional regulator
MPSVVEEIAKSLGVSNATVSRALNDKPGVGSDLRERILAKARDLNYTPSHTARGLATSQTFTIGFFVCKFDLPSTKDPFYYEIQRGAEQAVARTEYHLSVATLTEDMLGRPQDFRFTRERRIDGMILAGPDISADFIMAMLRTHVPVVLVDNKLNQTPVNAVNCDDEGGAYHAARYLLSLGHRCIGVIAGPQRWPSNARRVSGYQRALSEAGLAAHIVHVDRTTIESGQQAYRELTEQHPDVTAICAVNDSMAIGAIRAANSDGKHVPRDLSVIGFDDIEWAALNTPPLTTMHIPKPQIGKEAARRVLAILDDADLLPSEMIVPVNLIERESVMAYRDERG